MPIKKEVIIGNFDAVITVDKYIAVQKRIFVFITMIMIITIMY